MDTKKKIAWLISSVVFLSLVVAFFVTSVVLADLHGVPLVIEWQSWFGIIKTQNPDTEIANSVFVNVFNTTKQILFKMIVL